MVEVTPSEGLSPIPGQPHPVEPAIPSTGPALSFQAFAQSLRAQVINPGRADQRVIPGDNDEIWIKWLKIKHGQEKHSAVEWRALIEKHRSMPAYQH